MSRDVALVCGASGALGQAVVVELAGRGDRVVAVDRHAAGGDAESVRLEAADLAVVAEVDALWARLADRGERPRWVVNAVGAHASGTVAATDESLYRHLHDVNLATAFWSSRAAARTLEAGGAIVNVASRTALAGGVGSAAYAVAKAGVVRLTEVLAAELAPQRIRVNAVLPSRLDTPANLAALGTERMRDAVPPADVAAVIAFLCSEAARAITGASIPVYGWA
jgi:NAD(P)-dependent dehydrogenase (short-subunit alcohol dehydrogenase family)